MFKHQSESYRVIKGVKHMNWADCFSKEEAQDEKANALKQGYTSIRVIKVDDFWRVFVAKPV